MFFNLTAKELAARWNCGLRTVYDLKDHGKLTYYKLSGCVRFEVSDIEAYEKRGRVEAVFEPRPLRVMRRHCK